MKSRSNSGSFAQRIVPFGFATVVILMIPLLAMQFSDEVAWTLFDFIVMGTLLFSTGLMYVLLTANTKSTKQKVTIGLILLAALFYIWVELAVGVFTNLGS